VIPFRADGTTPNAFLPPPEDTDFPIVKRLIASDEQAGNFLKRLGLSEPDVFDDIVERVLPKYSKSDVSSVSETEHAADILKILRALTSDSEVGKKRVIQKAKQHLFSRLSPLLETWHIKGRSMSTRKVRICGYIFPVRQTRGSYPNSRWLQYPQAFVRPWHCDSPAAHPVF
jgi:hypothetical protein